MALNRSLLVTATKQAVGNRTSPTIDGTWYLERVHSGYRRLCTFQGAVQAPGLRQPQQRRLGFFELEDRQARSINLALALTSNFVTPSPSLNVAAVTDIYDRTHNRGLDRRAAREMRTRDPDATGTPRTWYPSGKGGVIGYYIDKVPAVAADEIDVYEHVYKYPAELASDAAVPVIPDVWHIAIVYAAGSEAAFLMDIPEKHAEMESKFTTFIAERKSPREERDGLAGSRRYTPIGMRI